ncbi:uncharacterized protein MYCFIDRAFT_180496 [Pseudocercospora fijiensis CIRAD86]|uniref:Uncharacterized protein n=1 Tax=Pseudocercospora fijiensis (strain CIRAD86) TaxID=383855 RepID=M3AIH3_PSEFD|nr:uncharacterized protein MYCFIDRAFT_180496 [Pseudocercospora fijiensis CIRAD86]EME77008.1 hypothetical protein MYCFIDRAFT_180496 [Pseudocercospora fijiensis CIRAD86]
MFWTWSESTSLCWSHRKHTSCPAVNALLGFQFLELIAFQRTVVLECVPSFVQQEASPALQPAGRVKRTPLALVRPDPQALSVPWPGRRKDDEAIPTPTLPASDQKIGVVAGKRTAQDTSLRAATLRSPRALRMRQHQLPHGIRAVRGLEDREWDRQNGNRARTITKNGGLPTAPSHANGPKSDLIWEALRYNENRAPVEDRGREAEIATPPHTSLRQDGPAGTQTESGTDDARHNDSEDEGDDGGAELRTAWISKGNDHSEVEDETNNSSPVEHGRKHAASRGADDGDDHSMFQNSAGLFGVWYLGWSSQQSIRVQVQVCIWLPAPDPLPDLSSVSHLRVQNTNTNVAHPPPLTTITRTATAEVLAASCIGLLAKMNLETKLDLGRPKTDSLPNQPARSVEDGGGGDFEGNFAVEADARAFGAFLQGTPLAIITSISHQSIGRQHSTGRGWEGISAIDIDARLLPDAQKGLQMPSSLRWSWLATMELIGQVERKHLSIGSSSSFSQAWKAAKEHVASSDDDTSDTIPMRLRQLSTIPLLLIAKTCYECFRQRDRMWKCPDLNPALREVVDPSCSRMALWYGLESRLLLVVAVGRCIAHTSFHVGKKRPLVEQWRNVLLRGVMGFCLCRFPGAESRRMIGNNPSPGIECAFPRRIRALNLFPTYLWCTSQLPARKVKTPLPRRNHAPHGSHITPLNRTVTTSASWSVSELSNRTCPPMAAQAVLKYLHFRSRTRRKGLDRSTDMDKVSVFFTSTGGESWRIATHRKIQESMCMNYVPASGLKVLRPMIAVSKLAIAQASRPLLIDMLNAGTHSVVPPMRGRSTCLVPNQHSPLLQLLGGSNQCLALMVGSRPTAPDCDDAPVCDETEEGRSDVTIAHYDKLNVRSFSCTSSDYYLTAAKPDCDEAHELPAPEQTAAGKLMTLVQAQCFTVGDERAVSTRRETWAMHTDTRMRPPLAFSLLAERITGGSIQAICCSTR